MLLNYLKFELEKDRKILSTIIIAIFIGLTGIYLSIEKLGINKNSTGDINLGSVGVLVLSGLVILIGGIVALIHLISSYKKDINEEQAYLIFSLPMSGYQILGVKLLKSIVWFLTISIFSLAYLLFLTSLSGENLLFNKKELYGFLNALFNFIYSIIIAYFSITLSKVLVKNKKLGQSWFFLYLVISIPLGFLNLLVSSKLNLNYNLAKGTFGKINLLNFTNNYQVNGSLIDVDGLLYLDIGILLTMSVVMLLAYRLAGYLLDKKIEI